MKRFLLLLTVFTIALLAVSCSDISTEGGTTATEEPMYPASDTPKTDAPVTEPPKEEPMPEGPYVILDVTGEKDGSYTDFNEAVSALPKDGGTLIVWSDYVTGSDVALSVEDKELVIMSRNGASLTVGRAILFSADVTFTDITLINGAANGLDFIYAQGNSITVTDSVRCIQSGESRYLSLFAGGAANVNITADTVLDINGGVWRNIYLGNYSGSFGGKAVLNFKNSCISGGGIYLSNCNGGRSDASVEVNIFSGEIDAIKSVANSSEYKGKYKLSIFGGAICTLGVPETARGSVSVDLSDEIGVTLGGVSKIGKLIGGKGKLGLFSNAKISANEASGNVYFYISGIPAKNNEYLTVSDGKSDVTLNYIPKSTETVKKIDKGDGFSMVLDNLKTVTVRLNYGNRDVNSKYQPKAVFIRGLSTTGTHLTPMKSGVSYGINYIETELECGFYCYKVYYPVERDYGIKYFFVDGTEDNLEFTMLIEPYATGSFMQKAFSNTTDHVLSEFYNTDKITGFKKYDTPTFLYHKDDRVFTNNTELVDFCEDVAKKCENAYVFYPIGVTEQYGLETPILVFTKDDIPNGASLENVAEIVRSKGIREIMLVNGGMHGNEPAGREAVLAYALELSSEYGEKVLDKFGAIILIPDVSADNSCTYIREYPDGCNSNRDLIVCEHDGSRAYVKTYGLFMPTVTVTCHEDLGVLTVTDGEYSVSDIHNMAFLFNGPANTPVGDVNGIINGTVKVEEHQGMQMLQRIIDKMRDIGYRPQHYRIPDYYPVCERGYSSALGSYSFLIELNGIDNGKGNFELRVHGHVAAIKAIADEIIATNGGVAKTVAAAREAVRVKEYDPDNGFILEMAREVIGEEPFPSIYVDGTYKNKDAVKPWTLWTKAVRTRSMPTAYVIPADLENIDKILELLDVHSIEYTKLKEGSTLTLRKYLMSYTPGSSVTIGEKKDVTFDNGAYIVSTDSISAYLIAYLFEPDSYPPAEGYRVSLFNMGFIRSTDALYRCEENNVAELIKDMTK